MSRFSLRRFARLMLNDTLRVARPVLYGTAALFGATVTIYLTRFGGARPTDDPLYVGLFGFCLIGAGMLFTGVAFQDMHHPLQRYQYLMLPSSTLERLLSRYLLTGPLFVLYGTLAFMAFDFVSNQLTAVWVGARQPLFSPLTEQVRMVAWGYIATHMAMFIGAICFRTHALLKTILFLLLLLLSLVLVENLAERILFPGSFSWTQFENVQPLPLQLQPWFEAAWMNVVFVIGAFAWFLYVAWLCLRDHEVTDGV